LTNAGCVGSRSVTAQARYSVADKRFSPGHLEGNDEEAPERVMPQSPGGCGDDGAE